jgi:ATP-dependent Clp protease ATP-binding subunit ClpC
MMQITWDREVKCWCCRIDEIHTLVGAGSIGRGGGGGGLDVANLLKPALARGKLQCIGATTLDEHRKHIEQDAALERRFQPVIVGEPSLPDAMVILYGLKVCAAFI